MQCYSIRLYRPYEPAAFFRAGMLLCVLNITVWFNSSSAMSSAVSHPWSQLLELFFIIGGSCHKYNFCRDKNVFVTTKPVFCCDKNMHDKIVFVATKCLSQQIFIATNTCFSRQKFCRDKHTLVAPRVCRDKRIFVMTTVLSRRLFLFFVTTNILLLRQNLCRDKHTFVATKDVFCRDKNNICGSFRRW